MPTRVATRGDGAVDGMPERLEIGASRSAAEYGLKIEDSWRAN